MPPKSKKGGGDKGRSEAEEVEEVLQAVVLADSFETRFSPFTLEKPRCLLPLANTPLIEYTLEFLAASGVQEVYLYCGSHTAQVESYLQSSKWTSKTSPFALTVLRSSATSVGDAMRDLDARSLLNDDFLIVYGDVVSNISLAPALAAHKARKRADKNSIMTMVLRATGGDVRHGAVAAQGYLGCFVLEPGQGRVLAYEQIRGRGQEEDGGGSRVLELDGDVLDEEEVQVRTDLVDCGIDIATPDVLALWSDNFDYEEPRRGFLHSVLKDYELNGKKIHAFVEKEGYAARVRNWRAYDRISRDITGRWTYPLVPDANMLRDQTYRMQKRGCYREEGVVLAGTCVVGKRTVIGRATAIGDGAVIENSIVGRRCVIGRNVNLQGSYIWDDVTVGDGSVVTDAIIANEASVGKKCTIRPGAATSFGSHVADGTTVSERTRITRVKRKGGLGSEEVEKGETDAGVVGRGGEGFKFEDEEEDEEGDNFGLGPESLYSLSHLSISQESISTIHSQGDLSSEEMRPRTVDSRAASFGSVTSDDSMGGGRAAMDFHHEASTQIYESLQKGDDAANMQLELTSLRMAADASPHAIRRAVIAAFMKRISNLIEAGDSAAQAAKKTIPSHESLLKRTMFDHGDKHSEKVDQVDFLLLMQSDLRHRNAGQDIMLFGSSELYNADIVETEGFTLWWESEKSTETEEMVQIRGRMQQFMDAIGDEESEEEDDDDEEDDD